MMEWQTEMQIEIETPLSTGKWITNVSRLKWDEHLKKSSEQGWDEKEYMLVSLVTFSLPACTFIRASHFSQSVF
jgi:hypothetical protein